MLRSDVVWQNAISLGNSFVAVGVSPERRIVVAQGHWSGDLQTTTIEKPVLRQSTSRILLQMSRPRSRIWLHAVCEERVPPQVLPQPIGVAQVLILTPTWLPADTEAMALAVDGTYWCLTRGDHVYTVFGFRDDALIHSQSLEWLPRSNAPASVYSDRLRNLWIGSGDRIIAVTYSGDLLMTLNEFESDETILSLGDCGWWRGDLLYAATDRRVILFRRDVLQSQDSPLPRVVGGITLGRDLDRPIVAKVRRGWLVLASGSGSPPTLEVHRMSDRGPQPWATTNELEASTIAILPTHERDRFACLSRNGCLQIFKIGR